jgi:pyruvate dehydrogenase E2 component (dihydrolipoamide acetyltransferase)
MATQVKMPQLGETVVEGTITRWLKQEGENVEADEALLEVSTDKVDSEIPAPSAGTITKIHAQEGDTVQVGAVLAEIGEAGEAPETKEAEPKAEAEPKEEPKAEEPKAEEPKAEEPTAEEPEEPEEAIEQAGREGSQPEHEREKPKRPAAKSPEQPRRQAPAETRTAAAVQPLEGTDEEPRRGILSPLVRKLAAEHNLDLESIKGTGVGGRITKQDVLAGTDQGRGVAARDGRQAQAPAEPAREALTREAPKAPRVAGDAEEVVQVTRMRKAIADHMVRSHLSTARAWNAVEIDMTKIAGLRRDAGGTFKQREGFSLTWMPFIAKATAQTLLKHPQVNATWNDDGTITQKRYVNLGIAVALENGLIVPVIQGADGMNLTGLARGIRDIADRARSKKLSPDEVHGGTFTITNPGPFGSVLSLPIINEGQAGILATDAVTKRPVVVTDENGNDSISIRHMVFLSMSWDHRVIDGAEAAQFLSDLKGQLEEADFHADLVAYLPTR